MARWGVADGKSCRGLQGPDNRSISLQVLAQSIHRDVHHIMWGLQAEFTTMCMRLDQDQAAGAR
jgi:hypothetical protein